MPPHTLFAPAKLSHVPNLERVFKNFYFWFPGSGPWRNLFFSFSRLVNRVACPTWERFLGILFWPPRSDPCRNLFFRFPCPVNRATCPTWKRFLGILFWAPESGALAKFIFSILLVKSSLFLGAHGRFCPGREIESRFLGRWKCRLSLVKSSHVVFAKRKASSFRSRNRAKFIRGKRKVPSVRS